MVGDFYPDEVTKLAERLFADWKNPAPYTRIPWQHFDVQATDVPPRRNLANL